jgi:hypothetical protein
VSVLVSISIFQTASTIRAFLIKVGFFNIARIRAGIFSPFVRLTIVLKTLATTPVWLRAISKFTAARGFYIILKCFVVGRSVKELWESLWLYGQTKRVFREVPDAEKMEKCPICYKVRVEFVALKCGHPVCYVCLRKCLNYSEHCPVCRGEESFVQLMEWADGFGPFWLMTF